MVWKYTYEPLVGVPLSGLAFMCIGADTIRVAANSLGSPSLWYAGALHLGFEGRPDHFVTQRAGAEGAVLEPGTSLDWLPFSLADIPVWSGSWSEFLGARLTSVALYGEQTAGVTVANYSFERDASERPPCGSMDLWVAVGLEGLDATGDGDELYISRIPHHGTAALTRVEIIK